MMRQYLAIKAQFPDAIVLYRMGDFYELFLEDAEFAAPILDITLTTRDKDKSDPVPMCGFPVHSADAYVKRLAELGHRVAICEQVEDPKATPGKRLVKREVVEVVTPGLVGDPEGLEAVREVTLAALDLSAPGRAGLAVLDASTGDFRVTGVESGGGLEGRVAGGLAGAVAGGAEIPELLLEELRRVAPREILLSRELDGLVAERLQTALPGAALTRVDAAGFDPASAPARPEGFDPEERSPESRAAAALLSYLGANQPFALAHAPRLRRYHLGDTMVLDEATRTHLELFANNVDRGRSGTLIEQLDHTSTALGARRLAQWLRYPLLTPDSIGERHAAVAYLAERDRPRAQLREALRAVRDLERILTKAIRPTAVPRDLGQLRSSLLALPAVCAALEEARGRAGEGESALLPEDSEGPALLAAPVLLPELCTLLCEGLVDDPPVIARGSRGAGATGYIRAGFRPELDVLRESASKGREWIAGLEARERDRSGIASLKIKYHPVHGYSLEVPKSQLARVPDDYVRKQTLANVERFTTPELDEMQGKVMGANERAAALEREILESLRLAVVADATRVRAAADAVATLDALGSLAEVARQRGWVRPSIDSGERSEIRGGRHPVVEAMLADGGADDFVPNDTELDPADTQLLLLTGPNMSGKSTYLRQVALITLMAQMGSFVPADEARIGVVDRIFTRVGASDRLARGESTFMVEMRETAEILRNASRRSLVILDEIGRGTSTFDGLSIAWAVVEYLHDTPGLTPRTLFATHYHELTDISCTKSRVRNAHFEAREWEEEVVFLRRLVSGGASRSYGIQVARLAGLPDELIARARQILHNLEEGELDPTGFPRLAEGAPAGPAAGGQLALALGEPAPRPPEEEEILSQLRELDVNRMTPVDALLLLQSLAGRLAGRLGGEGSSS
ncbi:MAG: DNA mismatch repair protein MutS [Deltaproteobacteria bacterium]|nr:DNA mismatch repair protein MutS [Deltaproteobacteria bacterium]MBW2418234.1 DNA mismatch repair protein MutS [Deltaproteobacteria bacterium]